jgi:uncharacterized protein YebE (UPF0316 family)
MDAASFDWNAWVLLPILIFLARVLDVSLGTLRIIFTSRGQRRLAPLLGFIEVFIWVAALAQLVKSAQNIVAYLGYAAGFAAGNYVGIWLENRLAIGTYAVRLIAREAGEQIAQALREAGFGVTRMTGEGSAGPVSVIYTIVRRRDVEQALAVIHAVAPQTFISIEEVRSTERGFFPPAEKPHNIFLTRRKAK